MNMPYEKFLHKFMKKINTFNSVKEVCNEFSVELLKYTRAYACWVYLPSGENNSVPVKKIYYLKPEALPQNAKEHVENIYQLGEDLFSNNYESEDTLDYFHKLILA